MFVRAPLRLEPMNREVEPIVLRGAPEDELQVIAEWVDMLRENPSASPGIG